MHKKPLEIICYLCQQSVEKSLKGVLVKNDIEPPHTHDLERLRLICIEYNPVFENIKEACINLREYATTTRYPDRPEITEADALYALNETERIYNICLVLTHESKEESKRDPANDAELFK